MPSVLSSDDDIQDGVSVVTVQHAIQLGRGTYLRVNFLEMCSSELGLSPPWSGFMILS